MKRQLNEEQAAAVAEFETNILVSAGAGTGKTSVLTSKFLQLLIDRRATVDQLMAITFTNKAAAEMRERIRSGVSECLAQAISTEELQFWQEQLQKLESARIGTFHSLCLRLIRENPLETGVPPISGVLDEGEETIYLTQAVETALTEGLSEGLFWTREQQQLVTRMLLECGWEAFLGNLSQIYKTIREGGFSFAEAIELSLIRLQRHDGLISGINDLILEVDEFLQYSRSVELTDHTAEIVRSLQENWAQLYTVFQGNPHYTETIPAMIQLKKLLPRNLPKVFKERIILIHEWIDTLTMTLLNQEAAIRLPLIGELLEKVDHNYSSLKREKGLLDFSDQQILARNLLRDHPALTDQIRQNLVYLLVDEFQDTNRLQMDLIQLLVGPEIPNKGRWMAVGDIKQSIYRFRGAEADLIQSLANRFQAEEGRIISLARNYRSSDTVIRFVNLLANRFFANEIFTYEPLVPMVNDAQSKLEFIFAGPDRTNEAKLVARRIFQLIRDGEAGCGDIVLLFRAGTDMDIYQQALQDMGIPFHTTSGRGFYRCSEIIDQLNLLRLVQQSDDAVALLALLISPYVGLSAQSLFWLGNEGDLIAAFYDREEFPNRISQLERDRLQQFRQLILFLQENREYLKIPELIRIALERLDYREMLWTLSNPGQRLANLEKLLMKAEDFMSKGFHDLPRFLTYIQQLQEMEVLEGEAQIQGETGDAVRLMTIHRAKGLEFPIVILPDLDRRLNMRLRGNMVFHKNVGLGFTIMVDDGESAGFSLWEEIKTVNRREEISELKRLLYVALTRAKQQLIFAGSGQSTSKATTLEAADSWMKWFELLIPFPENKANGSFEFEGIPIQLTTTLPAYETPENSVSLLEQYGPDLVQEPMAMDSIQGEVAATAQWQVKTTMLRVSELLAFTNCPRRYFWEYRCRLDGSWLEADVHPTDGNSGSGNLGTFIGNFIHQAVRERGDAWPEELWQQVVSSGTIMGDDAAPLRKDLERIWANIQTSGYTQPLGKYWDEIPFILKLRENLQVEGRFDRLIETEQGELILVDFKTHRTSASRVAEIASKYHWQLQLYALAIRELWGRLPDQAVLYFPYPHQKINVSLETAVLENTLSEVQKIGAFINAHHLPLEYPVSENCDGCGYKLLCSQGAGSSMWEAKAL